MITIRRIQAAWAAPRRRALRRAAAAGLLALAALLGGCKAIAAPFLMWGEEPMREVPAEFPHLAGQRVAIAVWADSNTLFEYPYVAVELSEHVRTAIQPNVPRVSFVSNRDVVDYQKANPDWDREDPTVVGARFRADRVLLIELTQYTTRDPESTHLLRGMIAANLRVYDATQPNTRPLWSGMVETVYPEQGTAAWGTSESDVRRAAMEDFALKAAQKFYDHKVKDR